MSNLVSRKATGAELRLDKQRKRARDKRQRRLDELPPIDQSKAPEHVLKLNRASNTPEN